MVPPTRADRNRLRNLGLRIRAARPRTAADAADLGLLLLQARRLLSRGQWGAWLAANWPISHRMARYYMTATRRLADWPPDLLRKFSSGCVWVLAAPKLSAAARRRIEALECPAGALIRDTEVRIAVAQTSPRDLAERCQPPPSGFAALGRRLADLGDSADMIHISFAREAEAAPGDVPARDVSIILYSEAGGVTHHTRGGLHEVLAAACGEEAKRTCGKCGGSLAPSMFSKGARYCKPCERDRVREHAKRKARKRRAA